MNRKDRRFHAGIVVQRIVASDERGPGVNGLLQQVFDAHGGLQRWNSFRQVDATIVSGGGFFALKGAPQDSTQRRMTVWLHEQRSSVMHYGAPDQRYMFTPERIAI